jgi:YVTN family beta-propeller protein
MFKYLSLILLVLLSKEIFSTDNPVVVAPPGFLFELLALNGDLETIQKPKYLSPTAMAVSPDKKTIYICAQTSKLVLFFSTITNSVTQSALMPNEPTGIAVSSDGAHLYVTCSSERWPNGMVCVVNTLSGVIEKRIKAGHMARSPVLSSDDSKLYVCNWLENTISFIDLTSGKEEKRVPALREPYSIVLSKNEDFLLVTNLIPDGISTDTAMGCKIGFISTSTGQIKKTVRLPVCSNSIMNICLTPDGKYAFVPHLISRNILPAVTFGNGWIHSNNMAIIDMEKQTLYNDIELDNVGWGFANPWSITCTDDSKWLCVAYAGSDLFTAINMDTLFTRLDSIGDLSHDLTFTIKLRRNVKTKALSSRSVITVGQKAYVCGYFSQSIDMVDLCADSLKTISYTLASEKPMTNERKGERYFIDGNQCFEYWQTCHSCHPFTRPDGLNWILSDSYKNSPKNTKSMLLAFQTPPSNWKPKINNVTESVRSAIELNMKIESSSDVATALDTFLMRLKPVPSPKLINGKLSESAQRGKAIFYNKDIVDCLQCHPSPLFTNKTLTPSKIPDPYDPSTSWDTPSIIECWRTAPYDHIGSYEKIEDVINEHSSNVKKLSSQEYKDLIEYILSL